MSHTLTPGPQILVLETLPYWVPELRRELASTDIEVHGCTTIAQLGPRWDAAPAALIVWDLGTDLRNGIAWLGRRFAGPRLPQWIACLPPQLAPLEWTLRGLGAVSLVTTPYPVCDLARTCRRLLASEFAGHQTIR